MSMSVFFVLAKQTVISTETKHLNACLEFGLKQTHAKLFQGMRIKLGGYVCLTFLLPWLFIFRFNDRCLPFAFCSFVLLFICPLNLISLVTSEKWMSLVFRWPLFLPCSSALLLNFANNPRIFSVCSDFFTFVRFCCGDCILILL